jgi:hypothetical protein
MKFTQNWLKSREVKCSNQYQISYLEQMIWLLEIYLRSNLVKMKALLTTNAPLMPPKMRV